MKKNQKCHHIVQTLSELHIPFKAYLSLTKSFFMHFSVAEIFCFIFNMYVPLSVRMWMTRVTNVSAPLGQLSTSVNSSGDFIPIPFTYKHQCINKDKLKSLLHFPSMHDLNTCSEFSCFQFLKITPLKHIYKKDFLSIKPSNDYSDFLLF